MHQTRKERILSNRESSAIVLRRHGVPFLSKNDGAHLIVGNPPEVDFWPGTGLWITRDDTKQQGRGVFNLLRMLRHEES